MTSATLAVLLPPSEGKASGGDGAPWHPGSGTLGTLLGDRRAEVVAALEAVDGGDRALLGVTGAHLERARLANRTLVGAPCLPAARRYTGVVWDHLDLDTLSAPARQRASHTIAVVSGLHGVVTVDDPVPDYRLKMSARLAPLGALSRWWRPAVSSALARWAAGRVVVDLLPQEHRAAWDGDPDPFTAVLRVDLVEHDATTGAARVVGHHAKAAKGLLARYLMESTDDVITALNTWEHPRFSVRYDTTAL